MNQVKLGKFIRELRNELGMTQQELADKIEVSDGKKYYLLDCNTYDLKEINNMYTQVAPVN